MQHCSVQDSVAGGRGRGGAICGSWQSRWGKGSIRAGCSPWTEPEQSTLRWPGQWVLLLVLTELYLGLLCTLVPHPTQIPSSNLEDPSLETHSLEPYAGPSLIFPQGGSHKLPGMGRVSHHQDFARGQSEQKGVPQGSRILGCLKVQRPSWVLSFHTACPAPSSQSTGSRITSLSPASLGLWPHVLYHPDVGTQARFSFHVTVISLE